MHDRRLGCLRETWLFVLLMVVLVPVEMYCAQAAWHTMGEFVTGLLWVFILAGNGVVLVVAHFSRVAAGALAVLLGLVIIPYQVVLVRRHARVQLEAARIVAYAYEFKEDNGDYPADLSGYVYEDPYASRFISYKSEKLHPSRRDGNVYYHHPGGFGVSYFVGARNAPHWYSPSEGWDYHPD